MSTPSTQTMPALILASTSRYRAELLGRLGVPFEVVSPQVDETPFPHEDPALLARRLAREKAEAVAAKRPDAVVIGADQVAICRQRVLGKPGTAERALEQLQWQRGSVTEFHSAVAVVGPAPLPAVDTTIITTVRWRSALELSDQRLQRYIALESPLDCAGAAKSELLGIGLLQAISSDDPTALVGLPLIWLMDALLARGLDPLRA